MLFRDCDELAGTFFVKVGSASSKSRLTEDSRAPEVETDKFQDIASKNGLHQELSRVTMSLTIKEPRPV
jgi:hypothetical protein